MNKLNIFRDVLLAGVLSVMVGNVAAQQEEVTQADSSAKTTIPGVLFGSAKDNNTAAISTVSGRSLYKTPTANLTNTLPGLLQGMTLIQGSGQPGGDNANWMIRGVGSYGYGGFNANKIYVDGFEVNANYMTYLTAAEIESISVLKDAAALSILGERGSNGVIWIETKRGKIGPATVTAQVRYGAQSPTVINKPLGSYDYASLYNQAISNDKGSWSPTYSAKQLAAYQDGTGVDVSWYDEVFKNAGGYVDGDITFNGGTQAARYNVVLGYANQQGLFNVSNTDQTSNLKFEKYNLRANLDFNLFKIVEAKVDLGGRIERRKNPNFGVNDLMDVLSKYPSNIYNVYDDENGQNYSGTATYNNNPMGSIAGRGWLSSQSRVLQGNFSLKEKLDFITPGLYLKESFSFNSLTTSTYNKTRNYARYYHGVTTTTDENTTITASGYGSGGMEDWKQGNITLGYDQTFGKHSISSAANMHLSAYKGDGYFSYKYNYANINGRVNYNYDNRYIAEFGFSYFGNDAFAPGNQWAFYPSISGAWILSNESFLKESATIDYLKLRASVGKTGSADSGASGSLDGFSSNGRYLYKEYYSGSAIGAFYTGLASGSWQNTLAPFFLPNPDVHAEKSMKYNVGIDVSVFDRLTVVADVYLDKRSDILTFDNSIMGYYGSNYAFSNMGKMTNKGFELMAIYSDKIGDWSYSVNGMVAFNTNKIDYMAEIGTAYTYNAQTGRPLGTFIGLEADGLYDITDFNADGSLKQNLPIPVFGAVQPGDIKYKDIDESGYVDENDITAIGESQYPKWTYSFGATVAYKGFDFSIMLQGIAGASMNMLDNWNQTVAFVDNGNAFPMAKGAWAYYPEQGIDNREGATYPRLTTQRNDNNYRASSFWIKDRDYLKVRNIELGYNFAVQKGIQKSGVSNLRVFVSAMNPFTVSKLTRDYDIDPESIYGGYPAVKSFNAGVSLTF